MSESVAMIAGPVAEPVTLNDLKLQLSFGPMQNSDRAASQILNDMLRVFIVAGRQDCENWCNRTFVTQTWILRRDAFPGRSMLYESNGYPEIKLPKPPLQSVQFFRYIDTAGTPQTLSQDATFGTNPANPQYGYQLDRGAETQPGRLLPPFARPWPPTRMVPANVIVQFRCDYGGPITCSIMRGSKLLTVTGGAPLAFNPDDAPQLPGETGLPISIPGAGTNGSALNTFVASVDSSGKATLAAAAQTTVANVPGWAGLPAPAVITTAIKMLAEHYYEHGGSDDVPMPPVIEALLDPYRNLVA